MSMNFFNEIIETCDLLKKALFINSFLKIFSMMLYVHNELAAQQGRYGKKFRMMTQSIESIYNILGNFNPPVNLNFI